VLLEKSSRKRGHDAVIAEKSKIETEIKYEMLQKSEKKQSWTMKSQLLWLLPLQPAKQ
jgi:hypothetical protein